MRILFLLFFLSLGPGASWAADEPSGCWKDEKAFPCAKWMSEPGWIQRGKLKLFLGADSGVVVNEKGGWQILKGRVWVESSNGWALDQLGRRFEIAGNAWIEKSAEKISIEQFQGETRIRAKFSTVLVEGFKNWWSLANEGVLQPLPEETLTRWNRWMKLPKAEAEGRVRAYSALWKDRVEESAALYREVAQRRIAAIEDREESAHRREKAAARERQSMRQMFRDRYFDGL